MKIVYLFQSLAKMAGTERILTDKMYHLSEVMGHDVHIITYEQGDHPVAFPLPPKVKWTDINVRFFTVYQYGMLKRTVKYMQMRKQFDEKLRESIERLQPDILICTTYSYRILDIVAQLPASTIKILESHLAGKATKRKFKTSANRILHWIAEREDRHIAKSLYHYSAIVTLTEKDKDNWKEYPNVIAIPNLLTYYPPQGTTCDEKKRVISVGRLEQDKGYDMLIRAWKEVNKKHPDWILDIYGDGSEKPILQQDIAKNGLENVVLLHPVTKAIYEKYMESDFYVMSSRLEGFGLVLIEAMSCGIPCVSFDCTHGPSDVIRDGEDGLLVEDGNIEQLTEKMCYLIEHEDIRKEMGAKARENVKRYLPENVMPQWIELFNKLTKRE